MEAIIKRLEEVESRYEELNELLISPEVLADNRKSRQVLWVFMMEV